MPELWGIILAAGSSTRLGRPKQLIDVDGESALARMTRTVESITGRRTVVVLGYKHDRTRRELKDLHSNIVLNPNWKTGMASSLQVGIHALPHTTDGALIVTCDQVELETGDLEKLADEWYENPEDVVAARYEDTLGVPVILPSSQFGGVEKLEGDCGAKSIVNGNGSQVHPVEMPHAAFDLDTPKDLEALRARHHNGD